MISVLIIENYLRSVSFSLFFFAMDGCTGTGVSPECHASSLLVMPVVDTAES